MTQDERQNVAAEEDQRLKGSRYLWLSNSEHMNEERWEPFAELRSSALQTARAWGYKEHAMTLWSYRSRTWARKAWQAWYRSAIRCRLEPVKKVARMIKRHLDGILTAVVDKVSNARAESINAGIQKVKYCARGLRSCATASGSATPSTSTLVASTSIQPASPGEPYFHSKPGRAPFLWEECRGMDG